MRTSFVILLAIILLTPGFTCHPDYAENPYYTGKMVVNGPCGQLVVQVLSPINPSLVTASWTDTMTNTTYKNVFTIANPCHWNSYALVAQGDTFKFAFDPPSVAENCMLCMIYRPTPPAIQAIVYVNK